MDPISKPKLYTFPTNFWIWFYVDIALDVYFGRVKLVYVYLIDLLFYFGVVNTFTICFST
jgi:hypothetical protein